MKRYRKQRKRNTFPRMGSIIKNLLFIAVMCLFVKGVLALEDSKSRDTEAAAAEEIYSASDKLLSLFAPDFVTYSDDPNYDTGVETVSESAAENLTLKTDNTTDNEKSENTVPIFESASAVDLKNVDLSGYVTQSELDNNTNIEVDVAEMISNELDMEFHNESPQILIIHTHGSECYTADENVYYDESDPSRTENCDFNMVHMGDIVAARLESMGIKVLHDRNLYDYPSYNGSYDRSMASIQNYLANYPDIKIVIDLHRDANESGYHTSQIINGKSSAQVMLIVGTDYSGLDHPNWRQNMQLAVYLQAAMNYIHPGLSRELCVSKYRYNQQATAGSLIAEIGYNTNLYSEAEAASEYFADCIAAVINLQME